MKDFQKLVLVVDDEGPIVDLISKDLENHGYATTPAHNGLEALKKIEETKPDLIISDINMPLMNGLELLISVHERGYHIPIVILTGFGDSQAIRTAWKFGAYDFLEKPIDQTALAEVVKTGLTLGLDRKADERKSIFTGSSFRNIQMKMDEQQFIQASELAKGQGLSFNSLFQKLLNEYLSTSIKKAS